MFNLIAHTQLLHLVEAHKITMSYNSQRFSNRLEEIIDSDDATSFVNLLQDHPTDDEVNSSMMNKCAEFGAKNCLIALIRGQVRGLCPQLDAKLPDDGVTALANVAHSCPDPQLINLMLTHCGATCLVNVCCTIGAVHAFPIHFALINLSLKDHLYRWYRGASIIDLVILLCLWETKPILDSTRLLAQYTDSINEIAWSILKHGGLKQFTALLLIAREKVIAPFDTGLTIHQYITSEIDSFPKDKLSIEQDDYKCIFMDARTILALFEATGDDLSSYCNSMQKYAPPEEVVEDICGLLMKNRVNVSVLDLNFYDYIIGYRGLTSNFYNLMKDAYDLKNNLTACPTKSLLCPWEFFVPVRETSMPIPQIASLGPPSPKYFTIPLMETSMSIPQSACLGPLSQKQSVRIYSTRAYEAKRMSKSLEHTSVRPLPKNLAYITRKMINRFRFL